MKHIEVVAAIIRRGNEIFATQRGYGEFKDWWEFPGGKIELGESPQQALVREIREELDATIEVGELLQTVEWDYPTFHLTMHCFWCELTCEALHLNEHEAASWLDREHLRSVKWLPADYGILDEIDRVLPILLVSLDVSLFADIFLRLGLKIIGSGFKQDSVDLQIFLGKL